MKFILNTILNYIFYLLLCSILFSCEHKPEFYINGKPYYTQRRCVRDTTYQEFTYHYGLSYAGKYEYFYGLETKYKCLEETIDTIPINKLK